MTEAGEDRTILFADIAGSTRLYEEHGDEKARRMIVACLELMEETVRSKGGEVIERIGDEILCVFPDPDSAAGAASLLQNAVSLGHGEGRLEGPMRIRVGFQHGPVTRTEEGVFGNTVHVAARVVALAKAGQTLTTKETLDLLGPALKLFSRFYNTAVFKNVSGEQQLFDLPWSAMATTKRPMTRKPRPAAITGIEVEYEGWTCRVDVGRPRLEIGRDPACDLPVKGWSVSQLHARILWDRGKARVEDVSTNGTRVERGSGASATLHHEQADLSGEGLIHLGDTTEEAAGAVVHYRCLIDDPKG